jgi:hypothetical protein
MTIRGFASEFRIVIFITIAAFLPLAAYRLQGASGLSLWDEGFLWYGAQRVMAGEVPIRDFQSYDIGRYYWSAGLMSLIGSKGILALRLSNALLLSVTIVTALYLVAWQSTRPSIVGFFMAAGIFMLWMTPDFKVADFFASVMLIFGIAYLIDSPTPKRYVFCGIIVGAAAILGRNHGLYGVIGSLSAIAFLHISSKSSNFTMTLLTWGLGVVLGYLPTLIALLFIPGFAEAFFRSIKSIFEYGSTNLTKPLSWPWKVGFDPIIFTGALKDNLITLGSLLNSIGQVISRILLPILPCFATVCLGYLLIKRPTGDATNNPVFTASSLLMFPYSHFALSRPDIVHFALGIFPFLIGMITFPIAPSTRARTNLVGLLFIVSMLIMFSQQPGYQIARAPNPQTVTVAADVLTVRKETASELALLNKLADKYAQNGRQFLAAPFWPGAYAVLERKAPTWAIYIGVYKESSQDAEITRIRNANIGFAIIIDYLLDGRKDLLYRETHPEIERYIRQHFKEIPVEAPALTVRVFIPASDDDSHQKHD